MFYKIKKENLYVLFLFILLSVLLMYKLGSLNPYVNIDEAAMGYTSWCFANNGIDRYGYTLPVYLKNFYSGQSIAYMYLLIPLVKLFGLNLWTVRLPMAFVYSITIFIWNHLLRYTNKKTHYIAVTLYAICPIFIGMGRMGLDCNLMMPVTIWMLDAIMTAIDTGKNKCYFIATSLCGIVLYTYALSYLIMPVFLLLLFLLLLKTKRITNKNTCIVIVVLGIISLPIILEVLTLYVIKTDWNLGPINFVTIKRDTANELTSFHLSSIIGFIGSLTSTDYIGKDFIGNLTASQPFGRCYTNFYFVSIPFFFYGLCNYINKKRKEGFKELLLDDLLALYLLCGFLIFGFMDYIRTYRINFLLPATLYFISKGISGFCSTKRRTLITFHLYLSEFILFCFIFYGANISKKLSETCYSLSAIPYTNELEYIKSKNPDKKIHVVGSDTNWMFTVFSLGGIPQKEVAWIDDTTPKKSNAFIVKNITTEWYDNINEDDVYIIGKSYIHPYYKDISLDFADFKKEEFPYYTVYWKEN